MPIYTDVCKVCGLEAEDIRSLSAPTPEHCGAPMGKLPSVAGMAFKTKGGNLYNWTPATGRVFKGGGKAKAKTIRRGDGLGGRRKAPSIRQQIADSGQADEIRKLAKGKTA